uniref:BMA-TOS-1 n=1 Tax=Brugia malayi TaxID=6279 RepID=A0A0J9XY24_BRUMA|nr:BMA-TOS-1 [Brugia malayi]
MIYEYFSYLQYEYDGDEYDSDFSPRTLLTMAIQRRRIIYNSKERDLRRELLHTSFIQSLCKYLGERRAKRHQQRRAAKRHRRRNSRESRKREYSSSSCGSESNFGVKSHPEIIVDDFSECLELPASEPENGGGGGDGGTVQFGGYNDNLYSLLQQDNCVQLPLSNVMEAESTMIEAPPPPPPVCFKKARYSQSDADPFGLDALFDELYGKTVVASGWFLPFFFNILVVLLC